MRYVLGSVRIFKLSGREDGIGLTCQAACPNCGSHMELHSKFYECIDGNELQAPLRDLCGVSRCMVCATKSAFEADCLSIDLKLASTEFVTREQAHHQARRPVTEISRPDQVTPAAYWQLPIETLSMDVRADAVHKVAIPALELDIWLECGCCRNLLTVSGVAHLGFAGKTEIPSRSKTWPLAVMRYVHFYHIGEELMKRVGKEYECFECRVRTIISAEAKERIKAWLDAHLTLEWLDKRMVELPALQEMIWQAFLDGSSGLDDHLKYVFGQEKKLAPHALRDWREQLKEFEKNKQVLKSG